MDPKLDMPHGLKVTAVSAVHSHSSTRKERGNLAIIKGSLARVPYTHCYILLISLNFGPPFSK